MNDKLTRNEMFASIFIIGFSCLMFELVQMRLLSFFLGGISNFLAIPLALFGLALGSMYCHFLYKGNKESLVRWFSSAIFPSMAIVLILFFAISNEYFPDIHAATTNPYTDAAKLLIYSVLFLPPYFLFGALLACYFSIGAKEIGRLYFFDLVGAGLGCLVTPLLFTYTDLQPTLIILLFSAFLLALATSIKYKTIIISAMTIAFSVIVALSSNGTIFRATPNPNLLARTLTRNNPNGCEEVSVRWNSLSRTSLLRLNAPIPGVNNNQFTIVQDDGISNIHVHRYDPNVKSADIMARTLHASLAYEVGHTPKKILVMFAGVARDMVVLDRLADGKAEITGVELNQAVTDLAHHPIMYNQNLGNFLDRYGINLVTQEGRDFLNMTKEKYDHIFLATNGSIHANRTGHSRKYLDTYEAMTAYLDHLTDDGVMVFVNQPVQEKVVSFRKLFKERGIPDFEKSLVVLGRPSVPELDTMVLRPTGLTKEQVDAVIRKARRLDPAMQLLYSPHHPTQPNRVVDRITKPMKDLTLITDNSPFIRKVDPTGFTLVPENIQMKNKIYASNWIKIITILLFFTVCVVVIVVARFGGGKEARVPLPFLFYFLVSGISYMAVEIGLIAKTELFLGNPMYAVAIILALFLIFNGIGALLQERYNIMRGPKTLIGITVASVVWSVIAVQLCNTYLLSIPILVKVICVAIAVFPAGTALGMFYPFGVETLVAADKEATIPMTYSIATLSSVLGSAFAMTVITNTGFSTMIYAGAVGYAIAALIYVLARKSVAAQ